MTTVEEGPRKTGLRKKAGGYSAMALLVWERGTGYLRS